MASAEQYCSFLRAGLERGRQVHGTVIPLWYDAQILDYSIESLAELVKCIMTVTLVAVLWYRVSLPLDPSRSPWRRLADVVT